MEESFLPPPVRALEVFDFFFFSVALEEELPPWVLLLKVRPLLALLLLRPPTVELPVWML